MLAQWIVVACLVVAGVHTYPSGPPLATDQTLCTSMMPSHNFTEQTTAAPFEIVVDTQNCYSGAIVIVTARVKAPSKTWWEGIMMEAREPGVTPITAEGTWAVLPANQARFGASSCFGKPMSAVHHINNDHYGCRSFKWTAPAGFNNTINFVATIVHETEKFWINVKSADITYSATCAAGTGVTCTKDVPRIPKPGPNSAGMPELHLTAMLATLLLLITSLQ